MPRDVTGSEAPLLHPIRAGLAAGSRASATGSASARRAIRERSIVMILVGGHEPLTEYGALVEERCDRSPKSSIGPAPRPFTQPGEHVRANLERALTSR